MVAFFAFAMAKPDRAVSRHSQSHVYKAVQSGDMNLIPMGSKAKTESLQALVGTLDTVEGAGVTPSKLGMIVGVAICIVLLIVLLTLLLIMAGRKHLRCARCDPSCEKRRLSKHVQRYSSFGFPCACQSAHYRRSWWTSFRGVKLSSRNALQNICNRLDSSSKCHTQHIHRALSWPQIPLPSVPHYPTSTDHLLIHSNPGTSRATVSASKDPIRPPLAFHFENTLAHVMPRADWDMASKDADHFDYVIGLGPSQELQDWLRFALGSETTNIQKASTLKEDCRLPSDPQLVRPGTGAAFERHCLLSCMP